MTSDAFLLGTSPALKGESQPIDKTEKGISVTRQQAPIRQARPLSISHAPFPLTRIATLLAGMALFGAGAASAAEGDTAVPTAAAAASAPAGAASAVAPAEAAAPEAQPQQLGGVTVRSRNRIEKLQDVPLSISVVTGAELARTHSYDIDSITKRAANVSWNLGNQRTSSISIRGVGKVGQTEAQDPSVGLIVDGVNYAYNALSSSFDFTDVDTVEVTRGPQGTLLGKNTSLGVISVTTRKPSFTPTPDYSLAFNDRDGFLGTLAAGGPVIDDLLAWRGAFSVNRQQGDFVNAYNRDVTYSNVDRVSGRVKFLLTPTRDFSALISLDRQPRAGEATNGRTVQTRRPGAYSNGTVVTSLDDATRLSRRWFTQNTGYSLANYYNDGTNQLNNDAARPLVTGSQGASAELNWNLGDHTLTSITAYKDYHFNAVNDEGTPFDVYRNAGGFWNDYKQVSQELRVSSKAGGFVDYQGGLYFINVKNTVDYQRIWGNDAGAWFATNAQYNTLDTNAAGRNLLQTSLANLNMSYNSPTGRQEISNKSAATFAQANWHISEPLTLTTGLRVTREDRKNRGTSFIRNSGSAPELNAANLGGFASAAGAIAANPGAGTPAYAAGDLLAGNSPEQLALANSAAQKYFGVADYNTLTAPQKAQIAAAKSIRSTAVGTVFPYTEAEPYTGTQPSFVISPSYKVNPDLTTYLSWQYGEKAGISQFVNGQSYLVKPEKTNSFELGVKSTLLNKTLVFNADIFLTKIRDYQQSVRIVDPLATANLGEVTYASATGNAPKVQVTGLEIDGVYAGIRHTTLRFSGAYNKAIYKEFTNSAQPVENGFAGAAPYRDVSGQQLAGAPKYTFNVGADYRIPVFESKEFHTSANVAFNSSYNSDNSLSSYGWIPKSVLVDWAVGIGSLNKNFDVSLVVKNVFDDDTPRSRTWSSYAPAFPRMAGIVFTGKL
jgi:iron complex outermembrane receptor protein